MPYNIAEYWNSYSEWDLWFNQCLVKHVVAASSFALAPNHLSRCHFCFNVISKHHSNTAPNNSQNVTFNFARNLYYHYFCFGFIPLLTDCLGLQIMFGIICCLSWTLYNPYTNDVIYCFVDRIELVVLYFYPYYPDYINRVIVIFYVFE